MDSILIKILAAFLALSQVTTRPDAIKTKFDPSRDQAVVMQILRDGCSHMRKGFDIESLDLDDLIKTAMDDPVAVSTETIGFQGLKFDNLIAVYRQFCKNENLKDSPVHIGEVIQFFNAATADLPDYTHLKGARNAGSDGVLDAAGERFADLTLSFKLPIPSIDGIPFVRLAAREAEFRRWTATHCPAEFRNCQTFTASPAELGDLPWLLEHPEIAPCEGSLSCDRCLKLTRLYQNMAGRLS